MHASTRTREAISRPLGTTLVVPLRQVYPTLIPKMGRQKMMRATSLDCKTILPDNMIDGSWPEIYRVSLPKNIEVVSLVQ